MLFTAQLPSQGSHPFLRAMVVPADVAADTPHCSKGATCSIRCNMYARDASLSTPPGSTSCSKKLYLVGSGGRGKPPRQVQVVASMPTERSKAATVRAAPPNSFHNAEASSLSLSSIMSDE